MDVTLGRYGPFVNVGRSRRSRGRGRSRPAPAPSRAGSSTSPGGSALDTAARIISAARHVPISERDEFLATRPESDGDRIVLEVGEHVRYVVLPSGLVWKFERTSSMRLKGALYRDGQNVSGPWDRRGPRTEKGGRW